MVGLFLVEQIHRQIFLNEDVFAGPFTQKQYKAS